MTGKGDFSCPDIPYNPPLDENQNSAYNAKASTSTYDRAKEENKVKQITKDNLGQLPSFWDKLKQYLKELMKPDSKLNKMVNEADATRDGWSNKLWEAGVVTVIDDKGNIVGSKKVEGNTADASISREAVNAAITAIRGDAYNEQNSTAYFYHDHGPLVDDSYMKSGGPITDGDLRSAIRDNVTVIAKCEDDIYFGVPSGGGIGLGEGKSTDFGIEKE
jgi:hypothetical protein